MATTNFKNSSGSDLGSFLVEKSYLIDRYPELVDTFKQAGLWNWGYNGFGILGNNTIVNRSSPVQTISASSNWKQVSLGTYHVACIKTDGTLWTWGYNTLGALGNNASLDRSSPVQTVSGGTNWKQVSGGGYHTACIKTDGTLWLWGMNTLGGLGQLGNNAILPRSSPVQTVSGGTNWKMVACGDYNTTAIKTDGTLWLWGNNSYGQLGNNGFLPRSSPVQTVSGGTNWKMVDCGRYATAAIKTDGTLWLWGLNDNGQLGDNSFTYKSSPVQTVAGGTNWKQVSCGYYYMAAIKTDGTLWTWGDGTAGALGDNQTIRKSSPAQTIAGGTNWKQIGAGDFHMSGIKTDGTLWIWGDNGTGALGDNSTTIKSSPIQTVASGTNWKMVSCGSSVTSAIRDDSADVFGDST
tara:strand:- start:7902 stop:9122 length:1221 start_codon:yes stop_codon:yes gene_type:complete